MKIEELVGTRVWVKSDQFRSVSGVIADIAKSFEDDDPESAVKKSIFKVDMPSGDIIEVAGSDIAKIDRGYVPDPH